MTSDKYSHEFSNLSSVVSVVGVASSSQRDKATNVTDINGHMMKLPVRVL